MGTYRPPLSSLNPRPKKRAPKGAANSHGASDQQPSLPFTAVFTAALHAKQLADAVKTSLQSTSAHISDPDKPDQAPQQQQEQQILGSFAGANQAVKASFPTTLSQPKQDHFLQKEQEQQTSGSAAIHSKL